MSLPFTTQWLEVTRETVSKSMVVFLAAGLAHLFLRRKSAAVRHLAYRLTFYSLLVLPVLCIVLPVWNIASGAYPIPSALGRLVAPVMKTGSQASLASRVDRTSAATASGRIMDTANVWTPNEATPTRPGLVPNRSVAALPQPLPVQRSVETQRSTDAAARSTDLNMPDGRRPTSENGMRTILPRGERPLTRADWSIISFVLWLGGALAVLLGWLRGHVALLRLARRCARVDEGPLADAKQDAARAWGISRPVALLSGKAHEPALAPMAWGMLRPTVLLPFEAADWTTSRLRSVLLHELAHVKRADWAAQQVSRFVCVVYWFHPLVWLLAAGLRSEVERACDDCVLSTGVRASDYASHLLDTVRALRSNGLVRGAAVSMAQSPRIEQRIFALLDARRSRRAVTRSGVAIALLMALCLLIPLAAVRITGRTPIPVQHVDSQPSMRRPVATPAATSPMVWGPVVNGLQAGIRFAADGHRFTAGVPIMVELYIRNASNKHITLTYPTLGDDWAFGPPTVTDATGKPMAYSSAFAPSDILIDENVALDPGDIRLVDCPVIRFAGRLPTPEMLKQSVGAGRSGRWILSLERPPLVYGFPGMYGIRHTLHVWRSSASRSGWTLPCGPLTVELTRNRVPARSRDHPAVTTLKDLPVGPRRAVEPGRPVPINKPDMASDGVAWGRVVNGLQAGIRFMPQGRPRFIGDQVWLDLLIRNAGQGAITFSYETGSVYIDPPAVVTARNGRPAKVTPGNSQIVKPFTRTLQPGERFVLGHPNLTTFPPVERVGSIMEPYPELQATPGDYAIRQSFPLTVEGQRVLLDSGSLTLSFADPAVKIAWGEPVNGLQAGLGYQSGKSRFGIGDTVCLFAYLRNTGSRKIRASYLSNGDPLQPQAVDAQGRRIQIDYTITTTFPGPNSLELGPGEAAIVSSPCISLRLEAGQPSYPDGVLVAGPGHYTLRLPQMSNYYEADGTDALPLHGSLPSGSLPLEIVAK